MVDIEILHSTQTINGNPVYPEPDLFKSVTTFGLNTAQGAEQLFIKNTNNDVVGLIPKYVSQLINDADYIKLSVLEDYAKKTDLDNYMPLKSGGMLIADTSLPFIGWEDGGLIRTLKGFGDNGTFWGKWNGLVTTIDGNLNDYFILWCNTKNTTNTKSNFSSPKLPKGSTFQWNPSTLPHYYLIYDNLFVNGKVTLNGTVDIPGEDLYVKFVYGDNFIGPLQGNADTATKLQTPRNINGVAFDGSKDITLPDITWTDVTGKPEFANVAYTGSYNDLTNKPTIPSLVGYATESWVNTQLSNYQPLSTGLTNLSTLLSNASTGYIKKTGANVVIVDEPESVTNLSQLDDVAISNPQTNQVLKYNGTNWVNGESGTTIAWNDITGKPSFATVATSGSYNDLSNKPTIPSLDGYATQSWVTSQGYTKNTGTVTSVAISTGTGLTVTTGSPITTSGTINVAVASGYAMPTTTQVSNWNTAYGWGNHASAGYMTTTTANNTFVKKAGDTMTGNLTVPNLVVSGEGINIHEKLVTTPSTYNISQTYAVLVSGQAYPTMNFRVNNPHSMYGGFSFNSSASFTYDVTATDFIVSSDMNLKYDIIEFNDTKRLRDSIELTELKKYKWKNSNKDAIGYIAQDIEEFWPELVETNNITGYKTINIVQLHTLQIEALKLENKELRNIVNILNDKIERLINGLH